LEPTIVVGTGVVERRKPVGSYSKRDRVCVLAVVRVAPVPPRRTMMDEEGNWCEAGGGSE